MTNETGYRYGCDTDPSTTKGLPAGFVVIDAAPGAWVVGYRNPLPAGMVRRCKLTPLAAPTPQSAPTETTYRYGCTERAPEPGTVPDGYTVVEAKSNVFKHGVISYEYPLATVIVARYELVPLTDPNTTAIQAPEAPVTSTTNPETQETPMPETSPDPTETPQEPETAAEAPKPAKPAKTPKAPKAEKSATTEAPTEQTTPEAQTPTMPKPTMPKPAKTDTEELMLLHPSKFYIVGVDGDESPADPLYDTRNNLPLAPEFLDSLRSLGVHTPITVQRRGDKWAVVFGKRRVSGSRIVVAEANGKPTLCDTVPARILKTHEDEGKRTLHLLALVGAENTARLEPDILWRGERTAALIGHGMSASQVAGVFGVTSQSVRDWLDLYNAKPEVKDAVRTQKITATTGVAIGRLSQAQQATALAKTLPQPTAAKLSAKRVRAITRGARNAEVTSDGGPGKRFLNKIFGGVKNGDFVNLDQGAVLMGRWIYGDLADEVSQKEGEVVSSLDPRVTRRIKGLTEVVRAIQDAASSEDE